ncbi:hypothetical protein [Geodermatophilus nigrescens]|uniref:PknH-like extracellular domain-containing protein n=1 Tax=Geodermatophilus nigrescens TaxID=1070870 RepID=A0A1M5JH27_9ACTN|nr:hypothetical protein [Geodermatophilus nigrescens]SHG39705.1 hypothetical protein SAMN05444351_2487 [Geodermatophilus nigrescens]
MRARRPPVLAGAALTALLLAGCGGQDVAGTASPASGAGPSSSASPSSSAPSSSGSAGSSDPGGADLAAGLLPAEAFGPGAQVVPVGQEQLEQGAALSAGSLEGLQVTPPECAEAFQQSQPSFDAYDDVAAQVATVGTTTTVEALVTGGPAADALSGFQGPPAGCEAIQATSPQIGTVSVQYAALDVPDLGDGAAGFSVTTTVAGPDGQQITVPALIGAAQDGERALVLVSTSVAGGPLDQAGFAGLLEEAFRVQADALD